MSQNPILCPKCKTKTRHISPEPGLQFDRCEACKGTWLDQGELAKFNSLSEDFLRPESVDSIGKNSSLNCPRCHESGVKSLLYLIPYTTAATFSDTDLHMDYCKKCGGVWLDANELGEIQNLLKNMRIQRKMNKLEK